MPHRILEHEHFQPRTPYREFLRGLWKSKEAFPDPAQAKGTVDAYLNEARWVVACPNKCGGAVMVTAKDPLFVCYECGSPENGGQWYHVRFPADKRQIEAAVRIRTRVEHANWMPGETVAHLHAENAAHGVN